MSRSGDRRRAEFGDGPMKSRESGMSLIELMIVVAILGLLIVLLSNSYQTWSERYRVETEVKEFYADLMDARARAMQRNRAHFLSLTGAGAQYTRYRVYEDSDPAPDGDGALNVATDAKIRDVNPRYPVVTAPAGTALILINRDGTLALDNATIRVPPPGVAQADYDCITLTRTRIKMGRYDGASCVEK